MSNEKEIISKNEINNDNENWKLSNTVIKTILDSSVQYLHYRWFFIYITFILFILSFFLSFIFLWWSWILWFIFFLLWLFKEIVLFIYNIIPLWLKFNIHLNWNDYFNMLLFNILIIFEIIIKLFLVVIFYKFFVLYFKKNIDKNENNEENNENDEENIKIKNKSNIFSKLLDFMNWKTNHLNLFAILREFFVKYYFPVFWTIIIFSWLYLILNWNHIKVNYIANWIKTPIVYNEKNYLTVLNKINNNKQINIKNNWITKLENSENRSKIDNIFLYYVTKNIKYIKPILTNIKDKNEKEKIININSYPTTIKNFFNEEEKSLKTNTYYVIYSNFFITKYFIATAYFNWNISKNIAFQDFNKLAIFSLIYLLILLFWIDITIIHLLKYIYNKEV